MPEAKQYQSASKWPPDFAKYFRSPTTNMIHIEEFDGGKSICGMLRPTTGLEQMTYREIARAKSYEFCLKCQSLKTFW